MLDRDQKAPRVLVFDSGVGGLSVLREISHRIPHAELVFACDNAAFPYGIISEQRLMERVVEVMKLLLRETEPDIAVIACNTASTLVLEELRRQFDIPFVGVVPAIKPAAAQSQSKVIGLLATPGTVERHYTDSLISDFAPGCTVVRVGSSELVYIAEQKLRGTPPETAVLKQVVAPFLKQNELDSVVLACTHFPLLVDELKPLLPAKVQWIDSGEAIARRVETLLRSDNGKGQTGGRETKHRALMTGEDAAIEVLSQQVQSFGLAPFEILAL